MEYPKRPEADYVSRQALRRQAADMAREVEGVDEILDTESIGTRDNLGGKGDYFASLAEIAEVVGCEHFKNPARGAGNFVHRTLRKFARNYFVMLVCDRAEKQGIPKALAFDYARRSWWAMINSGHKPENILRGVLEG